MALASAAKYFGTYIVHQQVQSTTQGAFGTKEEGKVQRNAIWPGHPEPEQTQRSFHSLAMWNFVLREHRQQLLQINPTFFITEVMFGISSSAVKPPTCAHGTPDRSWTQEFLALQTQSGRRCYCASTNHFLGDFDDTIVAIHGSNDHVSPSPGAVRLFMNVLIRMLVGSKPGIRSSIDTTHCAGCDIRLLELGWHEPDTISPD